MKLKIINTRNSTMTSTTKHQKRIQNQSSKFRYINGHKQTRQLNVSQTRLSICNTVRSTRKSRLWISKTQSSPTSTWKISHSIIKDPWKIKPTPKTTPITPMSEGEIPYVKSILKITTVISINSIILMTSITSITLKRKIRWITNSKEITTSKKTIINLSYFFAEEEWRSSTT